MFINLFNNELGRYITIEELKILLEDKDIREIRNALDYNTLIKSFKSNDYDLIVYIYEIKKEMDSTIFSESINSDNIQVTKYFIGEAIKNNILLYPPDINYKKLTLEKLKHLYDNNIIPNYIEVINIINESSYDVINYVIDKSEFSNMNVEVILSRTGKTINIDLFNKILNKTLSSSHKFAVNIYNTPILYGRYDIIKSLIDFGIKPSISIFNTDIDQNTKKYILEKYKDMKSLLFVSSLLENNSISFNNIKFLIENGFKVTPDLFKLTIEKTTSLDLIRYLLENTTNRFNEELLKTAIIFSTTEIIQFIISSDILVPVDIVNLILNMNEYNVSREKIELLFEYNKLEKIDVKVINKILSFHNVLDGYLGHLILHLYDQNMFIPNDKTFELSINFLYYNHLKEFLYLYEDNEIDNEIEIDIDKNKLLINIIKKYKFDSLELINIILKPNIKINKETFDYLKKYKLYENIDPIIKENINEHYNSKSIKKDSILTDTDIKSGIEYYSNYTILKYISKGHFGNVYKVKSIKDGKIYAMKEIPDCMTESSKLISFERETKILKLINCQSPYLLCFHEAFSHDNKCFIIMNFIDESIELLDHKINYKNGIIGMYEISIALNELHKKGIIHLDIKPENILISNGHYYLVDYGLGLLKEEINSDTKSGGTLLYMAPEVLNSSIGMISEYSDIYSLGVVFTFIMSIEPHRTIFHNKTLINLKSDKKTFSTFKSNSLYVKGLITKFKSNIQSEYFDKDGESTLYNMTLSMLNIIPENRPNITEIIQILDKFLD
jgi:tRNA A-37 threonylcarbamoyl transferase component Bud32